MAAVVGDPMGEGGSAIFDGDLTGEGMLVDRSPSGFLIFDGDDTGAAIVETTRIADR